MQLEFKVNNPADGDRDFAVSLNAQSQLAGADFFTFIQLPSAHLLGGRVKGQHGPLTNVLNGLIPSVSVPLPNELAVTICFLDANIPQGSLLLSADLEGKWKLKPGVRTMELKDLGKGL